MRKGSAREALSRKIQRLHRLTNYDLGTTINVGLVQGGTAVNTVAARATAAIAAAARELVEEGLMLQEDVECATGAVDWGGPWHDIKLR